MGARITENHLSQEFQDSMNELHRTNTPSSLGGIMVNRDPSQV